jgi:anti-anti-sigma factor
MSVARFAPPGGRGQQTMDHPEAFRAFVDGAAVVHFCGELDTAAREQASSALRDAAELLPLLIVDLSELEFMDAAGLSVLLEARQLPGVERVVVRNTLRRVQRLLEVAGLDRVFVDAPRTI